MRVLVIDDHRSYADAIVLAIGLEADLQAVGACYDVATGVQTVMREKPDVVLIDWQLPDVDGVEGIRRIRMANPATKLIMVTAHAQDGLRQLARLTGASALLAKDSPLAEIVEAVRMCASGTPIRPNTQEVKQARGRRLLTPREAEVLWLLAKGRTAPVIADSLFLSVHTVRGHVKEVFRKLGAHTRMEAIAIATSKGLLPQSVQSAG